MEKAIFSIIVLLGIGLPIAGYAILFLLDFFEKEFDYLHLENKQMKLEKELQRMEYVQLMQQIEPHFLFNSLNAMMALGRLGRTEEVVRAMEEFSQFLKYSYKDKDPLIPFLHELEHTRHYIAVQELRFGPKLNVDISIDELAEQTTLPPYMLQSFVENAFKHGLEKKQGEKQLEIELKRKGSWVSLQVRDNGPNEEIAEGTSKGIGLTNIRKRLGLLFDLPTSVLIKRSDKITVVTAEWPYTPEGRNI